MNKIAITILLIISLWKPIFSQDAHFTQFYASPLYLAPSFAGNTAGSRVIVNFRDQWPAIPGAFVTYSISADHFFPTLNSGLGMYIFRDQAGSGHLATTNLAFQYNYDIKLFKKWDIRPGLQFYYTQRSIDFSELVFNDQYSNGGLSYTSSIEIPSQNKVGYFDFALSALIYSNIQWFGFTFDHINTPNQSLKNTVSEVPLKFVFFGGYKIMLQGKPGNTNEESINLAYNYRAQGKFDQIDFGAYWTKHQFVMGMWYRGIPALKQYEKGYQNNDMLAILAGYDFLSLGLKIAYSYDFTISKLVAQTGGAHEISMVLLFNQNQKLKRKYKAVIVPCPKF
jgi:type IX secretion system PorP/SprF family membrane protein